MVKLRYTQDTNFEQYSIVVLDDSNKEIAVIPISNAKGIKIAIARVLPFEWIKLQNRRNLKNNGNR